LNIVKLPGVGPAKGEWVVEGHLMPDHIHMLISIPLKYAVALAVGFIRGKAKRHGCRKIDMPMKILWPMPLS
jgi:REP element-mobilizing transposase RayT